MIRVGLVQALIPRYREPVFETLAKRDEIDLTVYADLGAKHGSLEGASEVQGYKLVDAKEKYIGPLLWDPASVQAARGPFDVVILSWRTRSLLLPHAIRAARKSGAAVVVWGHGFGKQDNWIRRAIRMHSGRLADACLLYDPFNAQKMIEAGIEPDRVFCAPNAVDQRPILEAQQWWKDRPDELARLQAEAGLDPKHTLIYISRLEGEKRLDLLFDAMKIAHKTDPALRLVVVGDGSARPAAEAHAKKIGIDKSVVFTGAIYDERELAGWCLSACCVAYPVAIGLSAMHAFGYGLPIVTSDDRGGHGPEINAIIPGENGWLYEDGNPQDFAEKILSITQSPESLEHMSAGALASVQGESGWSLPNMVEGFVRCIQSAQALRRGR